MAETETVVPTAAHKPRDISGRFVLGAIAAVLTALAVVTLGVLFAFPGSLADKTMPQAMPRFPQPALQPSPRDDMARFYETEMATLNSAGWVDRERGIAHIPIEDAMRRIAREGIPGWPASR